MEKKYCPFCKCEQEVEPLGILAVHLRDGSRIVEYQCTKCCRIIRERKGGNYEKEIRIQNYRKNISY